MKKLILLSILFWGFWFASSKENIDVIKQYDGTIYKGKINKRSIKLKDGSLSYVHVTADQRWFDRQGMPIDKPKNLITRNDKEEDNKI